MKKLTVESSKLPTHITNDVAIRLSSHHAYGLYDFNPEKMVEEICRDYKLTLKTIDFPEFILKNDQGEEMRILVSEEHYGY